MPSMAQQSSSCGTALKASTPYNEKVPSEMNTTTTLKQFICTFLQTHTICIISVLRTSAVAVPSNLVGPCAYVFLVSAVSALHARLSCSVYEGASGEQLTSHRRVVVESLRAYLKRKTVLALCL